MPYSVALLARGVEWCSVHRERSAAILLFSRSDFSGRLDAPGALMIKRVCVLLFVCLACAAAKAQQPANGNDFAISDGDRVVFYGDSITEQRLYTTDMETFVLTRFPERNVLFFHSGVGGDRVSGGKYGPIDLRLHRDVFEHKPTVVTIMLGMNDGFYRAFDPDILQSYKTGYTSIVDAIQNKFPQARLTLIKPSPYDDVTRPEMMVGGYNRVLQRFAMFVGELAAEKHLGVADLNAPVVEAIEKAKAKNSPLDTLLIPDRIHPGAAIHWVMAENVLKSWGAKPEVSFVHLDAGTKATAQVSNTEVSELSQNANGLRWTQIDKALPLPLGPLDTDPLMQLTLSCSDLISALDMETLRVTALSAGAYRLRIDDREVGTFSAEQLASGVNLSLLETPMLDQARRVGEDTKIKSTLDAQVFELNVKPVDQVTPDTIKQLMAAEEKALARQRADAQPVPHHYELSSVATPDAKKR
jgi:lysophospholipase L1-like esterase